MSSEIVKIKPKPEGLDKPYVGKIEHHGHDHHNE